MSLYITSLNSGSNGNCYYIGNEQEAILVDAGLSCRETEKRMRRLGLSFGQVKAIFVSHEHDDHIKGIPVIAKKYQLPVYITSGTLGGWGFGLESHLVCSFSAYVPVMVGSLQVTAFPKFHDAADPHSFIISQAMACGEDGTASPGEDGTVTVSTVVGVFTDIGAPCEHLIRHFRQCHAAFLEANYDEDMLDKGSYPFHLKRRIRGGQGHLSNRQALELFLAHRPPFMSHLFLSHLSQNNNDPDLVRDMFHGRSDGVQIVLASRHEETAVYTIQGKPGDVAVPWVGSGRTEIGSVAGSDRTKVGSGRTGVGPDEVGPVQMSKQADGSPKGRRRTAGGRSTPDNSSQLSLFQ